MIKFNVFGKFMSVIKKDQQCQLFIEYDTAIRSRVYDVVIPKHINELELETFLSDIYH